jgi:hypothetical protein
MLAFEPTRDRVRIEANRLGVRPDEGAPEDAARPAGDVISFEPFQQRDGNLGCLGNGLERQVPAFALVL